MLQHEMIPIPSTLNNETGRLNDNFIVDSDSNCNDDTRLKQELRIAAEHCQLLAEKLCRNDHSPSRKGKMSNSSERCSCSDGECCQEQKLKVKAIVAENIRLRQGLKEVTEINKRWQKHNAQQQEYIQRLQSTIEILQTGQDVSSIQVGHVPFRQEEDPNKMSLSEHAQTLSSLKKSYEKAVKENCRLEKLVDELRKALESKSQEQLSQGKTQDLNRDSELRIAKEQAEMLRMQARVHKEDWEAEKAEKEEAKKRLARAEDDIRELSSKCQVFESRLHRIQEATFATLDGCEKKDKDVWELSPSSPSSAPLEWNYKHNQTPTNTFYYGPQLRVLSRGVYKRNTDYLPKQDSVDSDVELDCASPPRSLRTANSTSSFPERTTPPPDQLTYHIISRQPSCLEMVEDSAKDVVSCPSCRRQFSTDKHLRFLDHFESCQKIDRTANECLVSFN